MDSVYKVCLLLFITVILTSCGVISRQRLMKYEYPYYPTHIQRAIDGGYIVEGMNINQVYLAIGDTMCKSNSYYKGRGQRFSCIQLICFLQKSQLQNGIVQGQM